MVEKSKKQKCSISEEDISNLLQRYAVTTILALLQEVEQFADSKLSWKELVKKTTTGISNAREYQMLWRHLAYREGLDEKLEDVVEPLDDDSDLECELEAFPSTSNEASSEAAACVKVLIASGLPSNSTLQNGSTLEAPLTINIPTGVSCRTDAESSLPSCSMQGMNITVPVTVPFTVQKNDSSDPKAPVTGKKRRQWSIEEDQELLAAVEKFGPGNWAVMVRGEFNGARTPNQLAQRYKTILKQRGIAYTGEKEKPFIPQLSEAQLATRSALFRALDGPKPNLIAASASNSALKSIPSASNPMHKQSLQGSIATKSNPVEPSNSMSKSQITVKKLKSAHSTAAPATAKTSDQTQNLSQQGSVATKAFPKEPPGITKSQLAAKKPPTKSTAALPTAAAETSDQAQNLSQQGFIAAKPFVKEPPSFTKSQIAGKKPPAQATAALPTAAAETSDQAKKLSRQGSIATKSPLEPSSFSKSQTALKRPPANSFSSPSSLLDATAVAAGARIGSPETAASLLKAAKGNNAIRFTTSVSNKKPRLPALASTQPEACSGVSNEAVSTSPRVTAALHSCSVKPSLPPVKNSSSASAVSLNSPSQHNADATGQAAAECHPNQDLEAAKETKDPNSIPSSAPKEQVQQNGKCSSTNEPCGEPEVKNQEGISDNSNAKTVPDNNQTDFTVCTAKEKQNAIDEGSTKSTEEPKCESSSVVETQARNVEELSKAGVVDAS